MAAICVHLCLSVVNYEIRIIPACLLSAHALSVGWEWCVQAVASGVGDCCRWEPWLLKYIIYEILHRKGRKVKVTMSLLWRRAPTYPAPAHQPYRTPRPPAPSPNVQPSQPPRQTPACCGPGAAPQYAHHHQRTTPYGPQPHRRP